MSNKEEWLVAIASPHSENEGSTCQICGKDYAGKKADEQTVLDCKHVWTEDGADIICLDCARFQAGQTGEIIVAPIGGVVKYLTKKGWRKFPTPKDKS